MSANDWTPEAVFAADLGLNVPQAQRLRRARKWPHVKIGTRVYYTPANLAQIERMQTVAPRADASDLGQTPASRSRN